MDERAAPDRAWILEALRSGRPPRVLVVGDIMLDRFILGEVSRISPEAPVPVVEVERETALLGGAANVAHNLRGLECEVMLAGVVGKDAAGEETMALARESGIGTGGVVSCPRPTTTKTRILARGQQVVRVDREVAEPVGGEILAAVIAFLRESIPLADAVVVSDYAKGLVGQELAAETARLAGRGGVPVLVDPKPANMPCYTGATVLTPNLREAEAMAGTPIRVDDDLADAAEGIRKGLEAKAVLVTMGPRGMALFTGGPAPYHIPTMAREVFDVTGAGDTVIAALAAGIARGLDLREAAWFANLAAGIVVGKIGTATASLHELERLLEAGRHLSRS